MRGVTHRLRHDWARSEEGCIDCDRIGHDEKSDVWIATWLGTMGGVMRGLRQDWARWEE